MFMAALYSQSPKDGNTQMSLGEGRIDTAESIYPVEQESVMKRL